MDDSDTIIPLDRFNMLKTPPKYHGSISLIHHEMSTSKALKWTATHILMF